MAGVGYDELIQKQFQELHVKYPSLSLKQIDNNYYLIGFLGFSSEFDEVKIQDGFELFITIPCEYPNRMPTVKETGGRIPIDFHHSGDDLCLGTPVDNWIKFCKRKTLIGFVEILVVPFLFSFCFNKETGHMPFGQRSHYGLGIIEFYRELFKVKDFIAAQKFLKMLASGEYSRDKTCPCNSGRRLKKCHGPKILESMNTIPIEYFQYEYQQSQFQG